MQEVLWLAAGSAVTCAAFWLRRRTVRRGVAATVASTPDRSSGATTTTQPASNLPEPAAVDAVPPTAARESTLRRTQPLEPGTPCRTSAMVLAVANQLASISSGIEGNAQLLIEATGRPGLLPVAEGLWTAVRRLRRLHIKLQAFSSPPEAEPGPTELRGLLLDLQEELQQIRLGMQVALHLAQGLPPAQVGRQVLHDALLCLCTGLLHMELGALRLTISGEAEFDGELPEIVLALELEWLEEPERREPARPCLDRELECTAAENLIRSQGGTLDVHHDCERRLARAVVCLPAALPAPATAPYAPAGHEGAADGAGRPSPREPVTVPADGYGGVLILEQDPAIRTLLARELKARGRNVFACSDAAAARTLLSATPDRFELLILDQRAQPELGNHLAEQAARQCPTLRVCVLATEASVEPAPDLRDRVHRLPKPFGVPELRSMLAALLPC